MPTDYIKKLASQGKGSVSDLEAKWDEAKASAKKQGKAEDWRYIMGVFKKMAGVKEGQRLLKVNGVWTITEAEKGTLQTIIISKDIADSRSAAETIAKEFGTISTSRETESSYRFRQAKPAFKTYYTVKPKKGISLVYGKN